MASKLNSVSAVDVPVEVFRQFAWHLAGSLAIVQAGGKALAAGKPRPAKAAGKR